MAESALTSHTHTCIWASERAERLIRSPRPARNGTSLFNENQSEDAAPLFSLPPSICDSCLLFLLLAREGIITAAAATCEPRVSDGSLAAPVPTPEATSFNSYTLL